MIILKANLYRKDYSLDNECYYHREEYNPEMVSFIHHIKEYYSEQVSVNFVKKDIAQI